jgi:peptide/nickel transport system permease protein
MRRLGRFLSQGQNLIGVGIVLIFVMMGIAAPLLAPLSDEQQNMGLYIVPDLKSPLPVPPGEEAVLGTVALGVLGRQIDVYYTLIWGTRSALIFGVVAAFTTALIGIMVGAASAFFGGWTNRVIMRITDAFLAFPVIAGVILFIQLVNLLSELSFTYSETGAKGATTLLENLFQVIDPVLLALILFSWMPYARLTHSIALKVKEADYIQAARAIGMGPGRIIFRHVIPNSIAPAIVLATSQVGGMVLLQAALNFIGLDAGSEWGALLAIGRRWMLGTMGNPFTYWWVFIPITVTIIFFGIGWNLLGDGLNDWLNPRLARLA